MSRDTKGRFTKGNQEGRGNGGRPRRSTEERYLKTLSRAVTMADWKAITIKAIEQAKDGDKTARQWLSDYLIGKPTQYVNADLTSGGEELSPLTDHQLEQFIAGVIERARTRTDTTSS